ncbi:P-loop containing nucleoside triphosphate hydrolase protein [Trichoderma chlorosporum]
MVPTTTASFKDEKQQQQLQQLQHQYSPLGPFWFVPFDRNFSFVGRNETFAQIDHIFEFKGGSQPRVALCGLGGIGKSQIALEYCYQKRNRDASCSIFWVNAATVARFEESLSRIATECGISTAGGAQSDAALLLKDWLEVQHEGPWLMIIDNMDDKEAFFHGKMTIDKTPAECVPICQNGCLLFTTRNHDMIDDAANPTTSIMISELGKLEGFELMRKRLPETEPENLIFELLEELDYIPLAITQAIAFMVKERTTIQQYLERYRGNDISKERLLGRIFVDNAQPENTLESVAKTWRLSFESIRDSNQNAADLLCLINFFQHHGIPAILLQNSNEEGESSHFREAAAFLKAFSIVDENDSVFSTHRLVQMATRWWLEEENPQDVDKWAFEALKSIASQFPEPSSQPNADYFKLGEILLPHAEWILRYQFKATTKDSEIMRAKLLASSGRYIHWNGNYDEARARFQQSFDINTKYLGEKHIDTLASMGLLGWTLATYDEDVSGLPVLQKLVEHRREILGEDDPRTIDGLSDLATAIALTGDYAKSEIMQREALARSEQVLGSRHNDTMNCMAHLADVLDSQGKPDEAAKLLFDVYKIKKDLLGHLHPDVLTVEHNLAFMLCQDDEKIEEALSLYKHNLRNKKEVLGLAHRETLITAYNLIRYLALNDRASEARALCEKYLVEIRNSPYKNNLRTQEWVEELDAILNGLAENNLNE